MLCAHGWAGQTQIQLWRRILQGKIRNSAAAESEGGQKFLPPNPLPFCPPERFSFAREARNHSEFCSKNVRTSALPTALWFWISKMPLKLRKNTMPRRFAPRLFLTISQKVKLGGERGIRTLGTVAGSLVFETSQFNHSCTSPTTVILA